MASAYFYYSYSEGVYFVRYHAKICSLFAVKYSTCAEFCAIPFHTQISIRLLIETCIDNAINLLQTYK